MLSYVEERNAVTFPEYTGERIYMREFTKQSGLPADLRRWQQTVDVMLEGVDTDGPIYLMVDQSSVNAGAAQRRPGPHIDGYWNPGIAAHGPGRHTPPTMHWPAPTPTAPGHNSPVPSHSWASAHLSEWGPEALLLAADVTASRALVGEWDGPIGEGGDCTAADLHGMDSVFLEAGRVWAGNVTMVHESLPVATDCVRTLVRLNVPGWSPEL